jgi:hypothetical protein
MLTAAVVDDAGRLLDVYDVSDDAAGYARLGVLLVERSSGPSGAAIAADSGEHVVTSLLAAAGRLLAIADDRTVEDYAEQFADDDSVEEMQSPPAERRAVGLARALQAGALSALTLPAPEELADYKPVLAAHLALAHGRHATAVALREVLRELYPAALRAYPDPAEPVSLAVLEALPEPGMLGSGGARGHDATVASDAVAARLAGDGVADTRTIAEAVTALRVAIAETPPRGAPQVTSAIADAVRQSVAAVRASDAGCDALVATLAAGVSRSRIPSVRRSAADAARTTAGNASGLHSPRVPTADRAPATGRRVRAVPGEAAHPPVAPQPITPPPVAPAPVAPPPVAPPPVTPAASLPAPGAPVPAPSAAPAALSAVPGPPLVPGSGTGLSPVTAAHRLHRRGEAPVTRAPRSGDEPVTAPPAPADSPVPPPPPPGITPLVPAQRRPSVPEIDEPVWAPLSVAASNTPRAERHRPTPIPPRPVSATGDSPSSTGSSVTEVSVPVPARRPAPAAPVPGSRANWPLVNSVDDESGGGGEPSFPLDDRPDPDLPMDPPAIERVMPPWLADDLPKEPPALRLVEPQPLADRALRDDLASADDAPLNSPPLRLVEPDAFSEPAPAAGAHRGAPDHTSPPVSDGGDGDLLIFAATRSAWFTGHHDEIDLDWSSLADRGWQAAEHAAQPTVGEETEAGLPKRVPQANLVPGSPLRDERPLRIVRDAESIAAHTSGYFRGWRRGQEIGGYAVGGRPGREAAGGWDFSREHPDRDDDREYRYRSAGSPS